MAKFSRADLAAARKLQKFILRLEETRAPQGWWPRVVESCGTLAVVHNPPSRKYWYCKTEAARAFEVAVGAILTQNTAWSNVELALLELARKKLLDSSVIVKTPLSKLAAVIRSSGYYRQKAKKLKLFAQFVEGDLRGDLNKIMSSRHVARERRTSSSSRDLQIGKAREKLLFLWGIGRETADTILLFALDQPVFVVDAYTRRLLEKLTGNPRWRVYPYDDLRELCESIFVSGYPLPSTLYSLVKHWQNAHALIVLWGKEERRS